MARFTLRPAQPSDIEPLVALDALCFGEAAGEDYSNHQAYLAGNREIIMEEIENQRIGESVTHVCVDNSNGNIVAFCIWYVKKPEDGIKLMQEEKDTWELAKIATHPSIRGLGIFKYFMSMGIEACRAHKQDIILSATNMGKPFFNHLGFKITNHESNNDSYTSMAMIFKGSAGNKQDFKTAFKKFTKTNQMDF